jgi:two-component system, cell cycle sensor histidine kinase and response regulator CckA
VVDDDQFMLQMTEDILTRLGYRSLTATDGQAAIDLFQARHAEIDLVLLDLMLPKVSGDAVFEQIRKVKPGMAVLLISGFKRDPRIADLIARGCDGFLNKPYSIEELANAIRATLDRPKSPA